MKEGLGDAYNEDMDTFDIMNEDQSAFNTFGPSVLRAPAEQTKVATIFVTKL